MSQPKQASLILTEIFQQAEPLGQREQLRQILDAYLRQRLKA